MWSGWVEGEGSRLKTKNKQTPRLLSLTRQKLGFSAQADDGVQPGRDLEGDVGGRVCQTGWPARAENYRRAARRMRTVTRPSPRSSPPAACSRPARA